MVYNLFILFISIFLIVKSAIWAIKYSVSLAYNFKISKYVIGLIVVAIISILPETFISINASLKGMSSFGLATLFGSNVVDLTLVFALIIFVSKRAIKIESKILKNNIVYPFLFLIPILLGLDGSYSRFEGFSLIVVGIIFYYYTFKNCAEETCDSKNKIGWLKNFIYLFLSMIVLLISSYFIVYSASNLALSLKISPILIGMLIVGIGTAIPELIFSIQSLKTGDDSLAVGDVLGTVLADATVVVGILAVMNPFVFPQRIIYVTASFMLVSSFILSYFMYTGKTLSKKEAWFLFFLWLCFILVEYFLNK